MKNNKMTEKESKAYYEELEKWRCSEEFQDKVTNMACTVMGMIENDIDSFDRRMLAMLEVTSQVLVNYVYRCRAAQGEEVSIESALKEHYDFIRHYVDDLEARFDRGSLKAEKRGIPEDGDAMEN